MFAVYHRPSDCHQKHFKTKKAAQAWIDRQEDACDYYIVWF